MLPVANKRALMRDLGRLINRAAHTRTVSSLVVFTIQGPERRVRTSKGLAETEAILAKVAATLSSGLRGSDSSRLHGRRRFRGSILTLSEGRQAEDKAEDLSTRIAGTLQVISGDGCHVGWGIAPFQAGDDPDAVFERADADLRPPCGLGGSCSRRPRESRSGDDVGHQLTVDLGDLILQGEFAFLQALNENLIERRIACHLGDTLVQTPMLGLKIDEFLF